MAILVNREAILDRFRDSDTYEMNPNHKELRMLVPTNSPTLDSPDIPSHLILNHCNVI